MKTCPPCTGNCNQARTCPARLPNPIDEAFNDGHQAGHDKGVSRGVVLTLVFVLCAWCVAVLMGVTR